MNAKDGARVPADRRNPGPQAGVSPKAHGRIADALWRWRLDLEAIVIGIPLIVACWIIPARWRRALKRRLGVKERNTQTFHATERGQHGLKG